MEYNHPWNFGIKPSEYIANKATLSQQLEKAIEEVGLKKLDDLFLYTLQCPHARKLRRDLIAELKKLTGCSRNSTTESDSLILLASYVKPGGFVVVKDYENARSLLYDLGIYSIQIPTREHKNKIQNKDKIYLEAHFAKRGIEEIIEHHCKWKEGTISNAANHLVRGILYGYPIGDVIEFADSNFPLCVEFAHFRIIYRYLPNLEALLHVPTPLRWNDLWRKKIGMEGEEYLASIYRQALGR